MKSDIRVAKIRHPSYENPTSELLKIRHPSCEIPTSDLLKIRHPSCENPTSDFLSCENNAKTESKVQPTMWKRFIYDVFSLWDVNHETGNQPGTEGEHFPRHSSMQGERFEKERIYDIKTYHKQTETNQYTHFISCHPPGGKKGFIKGEAIKLLRTSSSKTTFEDELSRFIARLEERGYPKHQFFWKAVGT